MKKTKINPILINLISILLFICFFVLLTQKLPIKVKKYLEDYKIQLLIIIIILVISYYYKYPGILLFILFSLQYNLALKEYFKLGDNKDTYFNKMIDSIKKSIIFNKDTYYKEPENSNINQKVNGILNNYLNNDNEKKKFTNYLDIHQKYTPEQIIMI